MKNALKVLISDFTLGCGPDSAGILQNEVILFCMCVFEPALSCQLKFQSQYKTRMNKQRRYSDPKSMLTLRADILQLAIIKIGRVAAIGMRIHVFHFVVIIAHDFSETKFSETYLYIHHPSLFGKNTSM